MSDNFFESLEKPDSSKQEDIQKSSNKNVLSTIIKALAWLVIVLGFCIGIANYVSSEDVGKMFLTWLIYGASTLGAFAIAEIIQILHDIRNELKNKSEKK